MIGKWTAITAQALGEEITSLSMKIFDKYIPPYELQGCCSWNYSFGFILG